MEGYRSGYNVILISKDLEDNVIGENTVRASILTNDHNAVIDEVFYDGWLLRIRLVGLVINPFEMSKDNLIHQYLIKNCSWTIEKKKYSEYTIISSGDFEHDAINFIEQAIIWGTLEECGDRQKIKYKPTIPRISYEKEKALKISKYKKISLNNISYFKRFKTVKSARSVV